MLIEQRPNMDITLARKIHSNTDSHCQHGPSQPVPLGPLQVGPVKAPAKIVTERVEYYIEI